MIQREIEEAVRELCETQAQGLWSKDEHYRRIVAAVFSTWREGITRDQLLVAARRQRQLKCLTRTTLQSATTMITPAAVTRAAAGTSSARQTSGLP